jgi:ribosomal protein S18
MPRRKRKQFYVRRKVCRFCVDANLPIDYKDVNTLSIYHRAGKIIPAASRELRPPSWRVTGLNRPGLDFYTPQVPTREAGER